MPLWSDNPILWMENLTVARFDPQEPEQFMGIWSAFHSCAGIMPNGRRYENLSWRCWAIQVLRRKNKRDLSNNHSEVPALSSSVSSVESLRSDEINADRAVGFQNMNEGEFFGPSLETTSSQLGDLVHSISSTQDLRPLSPLPKPRRVKRPPRSTPPSTNLAATTVSSPPAPTSTAASSATAHPTSPLPVRSLTSTVTTTTKSTTSSTQTTKSPSGGSDTSAESTDSRTSIVRGFVPGKTISISKSQSQLGQSPASILKNSTENKSQPMLARQQGSNNLRGGASEPTEVESEKNLSPEPNRPSQSKKQTSFRDEVDEIPKKGFIVGSDEAAGAEEDDDDDAADGDGNSGDDIGASYDENAIEDDSADEGDYEEEIDESAIDDDEEEEWEDAGDEDVPPPITFTKIPSQGQLASRRSILSDKLSESARAHQMAEAASQRFRRSKTSTPNGPSVPASPGQSSPLQERMRADSTESGINVHSVHPLAEQPPLPPMTPANLRRKMFMDEIGHEIQVGMARERSQVNFLDAAEAKRQRGQPPDHPDVDYQTEDEPADDYQSRGW